MLTLQQVSKRYHMGEFAQVALNQLSITFRKSEFVAILGPSGSGKTTLLNIIGGLDTYDDGDLCIQGKSTKTFRDEEWDAYRNHSIGFIFQSYHLISHLTVLENVQMGMTLSGVSHVEKRNRALKLLEQVGLQEHAFKRPTLLSGGQMQRVAIARALVNDPDIILADEPTGALDSETSEQIMKLIQTVAKDKLVIMVTHNPELAQQYATRMIEFADGHIKVDSYPHRDEEQLHVSRGYKMKKTSMNFFSAVKMSARNIRTKKWRTALAAFASSIGIIGIALILSLSNGLNKQIGSYETGTLSNFPITIESVTTDTTNTDEKESNEQSSAASSNISAYNPQDQSGQHENKLTPAYVKYLNQMNHDWIEGISFKRAVDMNILVTNEGKAARLDKNKINLTPYPSTSNEYLQKYYDVLEGKYPSRTTDLVLIIDSSNRLPKSTLEELGMPTNTNSLNMNSLIGKQFKLLNNNDYFRQKENRFITKGTDQQLYNSPKAIPLTITGVLRIKENVPSTNLPVGLVYSDQLEQDYIQNAIHSQIVQAQQQVDYNVITGQPFTQDTDATTVEETSPGTKKQMLALLGGSEVPTSISIYPANFDTKDQIKHYLDQWNKTHSTDNQILYSDLAQTLTQISGGLVNGISFVLIAFSAISLVVSLIMIAIITYISVIERTKEIGILRALGARKKDITRLFNAETFIIGLGSGLLGLGITYLLTILANAMIAQLTHISNLAQLNPIHALILLLVSVGLTMLGGFVPSRLASKKDPVTALRSA